MGAALTSVQAILRRVWRCVVVCSNVGLYGSAAAIKVACQCQCVYMIGLALWERNTCFGILLELLQHATDGISGLVDLPSMT